MIKFLLAWIALSVGLGWVIEYNTNPLISWGFVFRTLGLVLIVFGMAYILKELDRG